MFAKIFSSIFDGTLATVGPWEALVTFENALILADRDGILDMTPEALARRTTIPLGIIIKGIKALEKPDPQSRTPDEDGRRLVRLSATRPWGWQIVNYAHYRAIRSSEDRREYMRSYQCEYRKQRKPSVNTCKHNKPIAYASALSLISLDLKFKKFWDNYPARNGKRLGKSDALELFSSLTEDDQHLVAIAAKHYANSEMVQAGIGIKDPKRFLRNGKNSEPWREWIEPERPKAVPNKPAFDWKKHV